VFVCECACDIKEDGVFILGVCVCVCVFPVIVSPTVTTSGDNRRSNVGPRELKLETVLACGAFLIEPCDVVCLHTYIHIITHCTAPS
jgi:hypothetical protein